MSECFIIIIIIIIQKTIQWKQRSMLRASGWWVLLEWTESWLTSLDILKLVVLFCQLPVCWHCAPAFTLFVLCRDITQITGEKDLINPIKLLAHELWLVNMNHIAGTTSYSRGINAIMPASHASMTHSSNMNISCVSGHNNWREHHLLHHRVASWSRDGTKCLMLHLKGILAYKTLCTRSGGWQEEMMSLLGEYLNPPWLGYLIHHTLAKVIPYFYLWPTLMFNMCM